MRDISQADTDLFDELWKGALFDILYAVRTRCADWDENDQKAMIMMVIRKIAERYEIVDEEWDNGRTQDDRGEPDRTGRA